ncbi:hypothetical protein [Patiriisocius hiemis]|uniref:Uncharacterized protein n=1 Tax=Patiriisocius hiemis TaxID=3075604 RepID=A0ABU2Y8W1_9FLAO|nr:hypothetical protein [Constantimarinum sp. W242]MDT0554614.1 hypothetical protein [Constantimarinum sp. W242]
MNRIVCLISFLLFAQIAIGQIDKQTENKIKVKYLSAQADYKAANYWDALENIKEIEALADGQKVASVQNIKVKCYIGVKQYDKAKKELEALYVLNPSPKILKDIASYESKINAGIELINQEKSKLKISNGIANIQPSKDNGYIVDYPYSWTIQDCYNETVLLIKLQSEKQTIKGYRYKGITYTNIELDARLATNSIVFVFDVYYDDTLIGELKAENVTGSFSGCFGETFYLSEIDKFNKERHNQIEKFGLKLKAATGGSEDYSLNSRLN